MKSLLSALLLAACAAAGCSDQPSTQLLTGRVTASGALAVRALSSGSVITAARVRSDGSFVLSLPPGTGYELQVLTGSGVQDVLDGHASPLEFTICHSTHLFDLGGLGQGGGSASPVCDSTTDPNCPPPACDPNTGSNCPPPPMCDSSGKCTCDPTTDPNCPPPPACDPSTGVNCPLCDASGNCKCDPTTDPTCPLPPPPCADPTTCKDPCASDPLQCGCDPSTSQTCWPAPPPCDAAGNCKGMVPQHAPGNFGCGGA
jgi:hypothetical protein